MLDDVCPSFHNTHDMTFHPRKTVLLLAMLLCNSFSVTQMCTHSSYSYKMKQNFATSIGSRDNEGGVQKLKWGHMTWVRKRNEFALSTYPSKTICVVFNV